MSIITEGNLDVNDSITINTKKGRFLIWIMAIVVFIILLLVFNNAAGGIFLTRLNINIMLSHAVIPCFFAWGFSFIYTSGVTDFSLGCVLLIACTMAGTLGNMWGYFGVVIGGIGTAVLLLLINFIIYDLTKLPTWITALGLTMIYESLMASYAMTRMREGRQVVSLQAEYRQLGQPPWIFIVFAIGLVLAYFIYNRTSAGLNMRAAGSNPAVAKMMGINVRRAYIAAGLIAGVFMGFAAFLNESYSERVIAMTGLSSISLIFQPLAAMLMAQVISKSRLNMIFAIPICAVMITVAFNMLTIAGVPSGTWQETILGAFVIIFGLISQRGYKGVVK
jgi:ribose transport system permease protein